MDILSLRYKILDLAIHGRLVKQDYHDEPAHILLKKIALEKKEAIKNKSLKKQNVVDVPIDGPYELPSSWCWVNMETISNFKGSSITPDFPIDESTWLLDLEDIEKETGKLIRKKKLGEVLALSTKRPFKTGDILYSKLRPYLNKVIIADDCGVCTTEILALDFGIVDATYVKAFLMSKHFVSYVMQDAYGVKMPRADASRCNCCPFPLPPLREQKRIASAINECLSLLDSLEHDLSLLNTTSIQAHNKVLDLAIRGKLVEQNPNDEPARKLLKRIAEEKTRLIKEKKIKKQDVSSEPIDGEFALPDSWCWVNFSDIVSFSMGKTPPRADQSMWNGDSPWVSISDMRDKEIISVTNECISQKALSSSFNNKLSPKGTLIMSFKLTIGKVSVLGMDATHNEAIISIFPIIDEEYIMRDYLKYILGVMCTYVQGADAIKGKTLNKDSISKIPIPLPPLEEQHRIVAKLNEVLPLLDNLKS